MKMKTTLLTIAMLTVTGNMNAMGMGMEINSPGRIISQNMLPSTNIQSEAKTLLKALEGLKPGPNGASMQLPADIITLAQNTLSIMPRNEQEVIELENSYMAYAQIEYPYMRDNLTKLMDNNSSFMNALTKYDSAFQAHQMLCGQLWQAISTRPDSANPMMIWQDIRNGNLAAAQEELKQIMTPVTVTTQQQATAQKVLATIIASSEDLKKQLTSLQSMFTQANPTFGDHLTKITYLVKQNIQWVIAFGMTINPDFIKSLTEENINTLTTTLTNLHTPARVVVQKQQLATTHAARMVKTLNYNVHN